MSTLAWKILSLFVNQTERTYKGEYGRGYLACWSIRELLGTDEIFDSVGIKYAGSLYHTGKCELAMHELVTLGLIEEVPDLGERYRLVVKD
jgi:hypothetical protein